MQQNAVLFHLANSFGQMEKNEKKKKLLALAMLNLPLVI